MICFQAQGQRLGLGMQRPALARHPSLTDAKPKRLQIEGCRPQPDVPRHLLHLCPGAPLPYSYRSASTGSSLAAFHAGYAPKKTPISAESSSAAVQNGEIAAGSEGNASRAVGAAPPSTLNQCQRAPSESNSRAEVFLWLKREKSLEVSFSRLDLGGQRLATLARLA